MSKQLVLVIVEGGVADVALSPSLELTGVAVAVADKDQNAHVFGELLPGDVFWLDEPDGRGPILWQKYAGDSRYNARLYAGEADPAIHVNEGEDVVLVMEAGEADRPAGDAGVVGEVFVDDDGYPAFRQEPAALPGQTIFWTLHYSGWQAFTDDDIDPFYATGERTYPTADDLAAAAQAMAQAMAPMAQAPMAQAPMAQAVAPLAQAAAPLAPSEDGQDEEAS